MPKWERQSLTHGDNTERAYLSAARRTERGIDARIESALLASKVHYEKTGKLFYLTHRIVSRNRPYEDLDEEEQFNDPQLLTPKEIDINQVRAEWKRDMADLGILEPSTIPCVHHQHHTHGSGLTPSMMSRFPPPQYMASQNLAPSELDLQIAMFNDWQLQLLLNTQAPPVGSIPAQTQLIDVENYQGISWGAGEQVPNLIMEGMFPNETYIPATLSTNPQTVAAEDYTGFSSGLLEQPHFEGTDLLAKGMFSNETYVPADLPTTNPQQITLEDYMRFPLGPSGQPHFEEPDLIAEWLSNQTYVPTNFPANPQPVTAEDYMGFPLGPSEQPLFENPPLIVEGVVSVETCIPADPASDDPDYFPGKEFCRWSPASTESLQGDRKDEDQRKETEEEEEDKELWGPAAG